MEKTIDLIDKVLISRSLDISDTLIRNDYVTIMGTDGAGFTVAVTCKKEDIDVRTIIADDMNTNFSTQFSYIEGEDVEDKLGHFIDILIERAEE